MVATDRRLAAIMFTDIVGYTRMTQARESLALELLEEHRGIVRPLLPRHGGTEVKTIGDAFLVEFKSTLEAVLCAVEIQDKMAERNSKVAADRRVQIRIGIHLGDVVHGSGDVYGDAVNVASRIEPLAEPGGVCISQQVYDSIRNKSELLIFKVGEVELKNVEIPLGVYKIELSGPTQVPTRNASRERLAVLPFVNISPDPNDEYFADGLTEELISKLSEVKGLKVIARTSVMSYKKKEKSISQIGRELEAGSIIEGSVRKAGNKIRVTVQLIDSKTEEHLWASNYDEELDDIFAIQSDIAVKVASSVSKGLVPSLKRQETRDVEAYTIYLKAMQLSHEGTEPALRESMSLFDRAVTKDPGFARALAGMSFTVQQLAAGGYEDFSIIQEKAEPAALRALELDSELAEGHAALAGVANLLDRYDQVLAEAGAAVKINPNLSEAHFALGVVQSSVGRLQEGLASFETAYELDPLSMRTAELLARVASVSGKRERAREVLRRMDGLSPSNPRILNGLAECDMMDQKWDDAQRLVTEGLKVSPREPVLLLNQGLIYALTGRVEEASSSLLNIMEMRSETMRLYGQLFISAALGDLDTAFSALMRMTETHSWPFLIESTPVLSELRKDPRYQEFKTKVGFLA